MADLSPADALDRVEATFEAFCLAEDTGDEVATRMAERAYKAAVLALESTDPPAPLMTTPVALQDAWRRAHDDEPMHPRNRRVGAPVVPTMPDQSGMWQEDAHER